MDAFPDSSLTAEVIIAFGMLSTRDSYNNDASVTKACFLSWTHWSAADIVLENLLINETLFFKVACFIIMDNQNTYGEKRNPTGFSWNLCEIQADLFPKLNNS